MIRLIEALNFRCLRYIYRPLRAFQILVGPNASGKTTFLDVVAFLGRLVSQGLEAAVEERTQDIRDLFWNRQGDRFELAIEVLIPEPQRQKLDEPFDAVRYEVRIGVDEAGEPAILEERAWLKPPEPESPNPEQPKQRMFFPQEVHPPQTILTCKRRPGQRRIVSKAQGGNDNYYVELRSPKGGKGWFPSIRLGPRRSALANLPEDEAKFPVATWLKSLLVAGVQVLMLNSLLLRKPSPPGQVRGFKPDGSNLPWVAAELAKDHKRFRDWLRHLRTALPDLETIRTVQREEDKHCYLVICYKRGLEVPSWMASDGTLRLLALTIPAYLASFRGVYLIEEPENGIHPRALETLFQSLSSVYDAQILVATHSPVILSLASPEQVLCFQRTEQGATDIVCGTQHPALANWKGETNLGSLFAAGVLG